MFRSTTFKPKTTLSLVLVGLILGVALYLIFYWVYLRPSTGPGSLSILGLGKDDTHISRVLMDSIASIEDLTDLEDISSRFARDIALLNLLVQTDEQEALALLNQSKTITSKSLRRYTQKKILHHLTEIAPVLAFNTATSFPNNLAEDFVITVFEEWSLMNLESMVQFVSTIDIADRRLALKAVVSERSDISEVEIHELGRTLGIEQFAKLLTQERLVDKIYLENPKEAWATIVSDPLQDSLQRDLLEKIGMEWIQQEGLEAFAANANARWNEPLVGLELMRDVVTNYAFDDPQQAYKECLKLTPDDGGNFIQDVVVSLWARLDPLAVFDAISTIPVEAIHRRLGKVIIISWIRDSPNEVIEQISAVPLPLRSFAREHAISALTDQDPLMAVELIKNPDNRFTIATHAPLLLERWVLKDSKSAYEWVVNDPDTVDTRDDLLGIVLLNMAHYEPALALDLALKHPRTDLDFAYEDHDSSVIQIVVERDTDLAIELVSQMKEYSKLKAYISIGEALVEKMDFDRAIALADQVLEADKSEYFDFVLGRWCNHHCSSLYEQFAQLPDVAKAPAAKQIFFFGHQTSFLNDHQLDDLRTFIDEDDPMLERYP